MQFLLTVAWRNLWRHQRRSLITATAMAIAAGLCMATIALNDGMFAKIFDVMVEQQLGHVQVHNPAYPGKRGMFDTLPHATALLQTLDGVEGTKAAAGRLSGYALVGGPQKSAGAQLIGIDPVRDGTVSPVLDRLVAGEGLDEAPAKQVLLGKGLFEELEVELGGEVVMVTQSADGSMGNDLYTVRGAFKTGNGALDRGGVFMHLADLQELLVLPDQVHGVTLLSDDPDAIEAYVEGVRGAVASDVVEVQAWWEANPQAAEMMAMRDASAWIVLGIVFTVAAFGVLNTMMMSVFERTRELGVLRALGIRPGRLVGLIVFESFFLSAIASVLGLALGGALDAYLVFVGIDFSAGAEDGISFMGVVLDPVMHGIVRPQGIALVVGSLIAVSVLASIYPAARAARLQPVEAIRSE